MKLPAVLKRVNRGLVLGALCIILVAVYIITGNASLQRQRGDIKAFLQEFFNQYTSAVLLPEQYHNPNEAVPQSVADECYAKIERFVDDYFATSDPNAFLDSSEVKYRIKESVELAFNNGRVRALSISLGDITKAARLSSRYVEVKIPYTLEIKYSGTGYYFNGSYTESTDFYVAEPIVNDDKEGDVISSPSIDTETGASKVPDRIPQQEQTQTQKGTVEAVLRKSGDTWRVVTYSLKIDPWEGRW